MLGRLVPCRWSSAAAQTRLVARFRGRSHVIRLSFTRIHTGEFFGFYLDQSFPHYLIPHQMCFQYSAVCKSWRSREIKRERAGEVVQVEDLFFLLLHQMAGRHIKNKRHKYLNYWCFLFFFCRMQALLYFFFEMFIRCFLFAFIFVYSIFS